MAKADAGQRPQQALQLRAAFAPATVNAEARTVEVVWTTGARVKRSDWAGNSYIEELSLAPGAVRLERLNSGAPLLDSHDSFSLGSQIGVVERAWIANGEGRAVVRLSKRAEVEPIWQDIVNGIYRSVSVGYRTHKTERDDTGDTPVERAVDWEPFELSLVPIPADAGAQVRSENITQGDNMANAIDNNANDQERQQPTASERRRATEILDACRKADLDQTVAERLIADGTPIDAARAAILDAMYERHSQQPKTQARIDVSPASGAQTPLQRGIDAALVRGEHVVLDDLLRAEGVRGRSALERIENALMGRGMHATTDLPLALTSGFDTRLQQQFPQWMGGIMNAAEVDPIRDFRPYGVIDTGLVGTAKRVKEGGEVNYTRIKESGILTQAYKYEHAVAWSQEAQANDAFLGGLRQGVEELGMGALDAEKTELIYQLEGTANGGTCADGQALFHNSHNNAVSAGPIGIDKLGEAIALLRAQKSVGGRYIDQQPGMILCGTAAELTIRQLLSDTLVANAPENVNPWRDLQIEVEPRLGDTYCYLLSAGPRRPLQLGRLYAAPRITSTVDFETGAFKVKASHAFGVAVTEYRAIVRVKLSA